MIPCLTYWGAFSYMHRQSLGRFWWRSHLSCQEPVSFASCLLSGHNVEHTHCCYLFCVGISCSILERLLLSSSVNPLWLISIVECSLIMLFFACLWRCTTSCNQSRARLSHHLQSTGYLVGLLYFCQVYSLYFNFMCSHLLWLGF